MKNSIFKLFLVVFVSLFLSNSLYTQDNKKLGSKKANLVNLKGGIYFLEDAEEIGYSNIAGKKPIGYIYTELLDYPVRDFEEGFPGITDRYEFFGIEYTGYFEVSQPGLYNWRLVSDDGSRLWIDGKEIIDNDGIHAEAQVEGGSELEKGLHKIKVWFFQGPAMELGIQLFVTPPGQNEKIFNLKDFSDKLLAALKKVNAEATEEGIKIKLPDKILFDVAKYDLKPSASEAISALAEIISQYPESNVRIEGHTDNTGDDVSNQTLSENRAKSVLNELQKNNIPSTVKITTAGFGSTKPVASNKTEAGKAKNRRVEVVILP